jgi:hypothetical protein
MLSAPPVGSSVAIEPPSEQARPRRRRPALIATIAITLLAIGGLVSFGLLGSSEKAADPTPGAAPIPVAAAAPAPEPALTTDTPPATPPATSLADKSASPSRKSPSKAVIAKKPRSAQPASAKGETDEGNLFPGRK